MPRPSVWPPRICLHKQSNRERCWVNGAWEYLGPAGSEQARTAYAALLARTALGAASTSGARLAHVEPAPITVADVCANALMSGAERR
jgi:hypothetical protein